MKIVLKNTSIAFLGAALLGLTACGKKEAPPPAVEAPEAPEVVKEKEARFLTEGRVNIYALKGWTEGEVEILILDDFPDTLKKTLTEQQQLLKAFMEDEKKKASGETADSGEAGEEEAGDGMDWLSDEDRKSLEEELATLKKQYPDPVESTFSTGSGASRTYRVRDAVYSRYKPMVEAVRIDHIQDDLNAIFDKLREDYEVLDAQSDGESDTANQAKADINWMAVFTDPYLQEYVRVVRRMDSLQRRSALRARRESLSQRRSGARGTTASRQVQLSPDEAWEKFMFENERQIDTRLFSLTRESAFAGEDGRFSVEGKGPVVARIKIKGRAVYFPADFKDTPVVYSDIKVVEQVENQ